MVLQSKRFCSLLMMTFVLAQFGAGLGMARADEANQEIINLVIDELKSGDPERQGGAVAIARDIPGAGVTKALAAELPNLSPPVQVQLLSALADRGDVVALPAVIEAGTSPAESVRVAALKAVGQLGGASDVLLLAQRAAETKADEQRAARESLYRLRGSETDAAILKELPATAIAVKVELVRAIGERNITQGVSVLLTAAKDENRSVRREAIRVLKVVAGPDDLSALVNLLLSQAGPSDRTEAEKTVAAVAHKIEDKNRQATAVLAALATVEESSKRASLLRVLGRIGDNNALPILRTSLGSQEAQIQDAAIRSLSDWPTPEPADDLLNAAQTADNQVHKVLALRGFVRLLGQRSDLPAQDAIALYQKAMDLAPNAVEKKRVLSGLSGEKSLAALEMAAGYLSDPMLHLEAESAVVQIARSIRGTYPQQALGMLEQVVKGTANETIHQQAQGLIDQIKGLGSTELPEVKTETQ